MSRTLNTLLALLIIVAAGAILYRRMTASPPAPPPPPPLGQATPDQRVAASPKGTLKNPYANDIRSVAAEGHDLFIKSQCIGCHGLDGNGHVCPPLDNGVWIYGSSSDDTLFRLITVGSGGMRAQGFSRVHPEGIGAMPPMGTVIKTDADIWKIISWIRSIQPGEQSSGPGAPAAPQAQALPQPQ